jgi:hypothetical protein
VVERWSAVLPGQADKAGTYLNRVDEVLRSKKLPFASHREHIAINLTSSETYDFLVCEMNADFSSFTSCIPAGSDLEVSWLVQNHMIRGIYRVPILGPLLLSVMKRYTFANGNKVRAFASATHGSAVEAAETILDEARGGQEPAEPEDQREAGAAVSPDAYALLMKTVWRDKEDPMAKEKQRKYMNLAWKGLAAGTVALIAGAVIVAFTHWGPEVDLWAAGVVFTLFFSCFDLAKQAILLAAQED